MKKKIITLVATAILLIANTLSAQQTTIKGKIRDTSDKNPIEYASIVLLDRDSIYIAGSNSNMEGYFEINVPTVENTILSASYIGYETAYYQANTFKTNDTINLYLKQSSVDLNEVTIHARSVIDKDDKKIIYLSQEQVKMATDGMDVIRKMQLPRIMVDPISGEISMSGNGVIQLQINGVQVTNAEAASIPTTDIIRIEYYDAPGARYGNADAVINYITRRKEAGGNINGVFFNGGAHKRKSLDNRLSLKYNYGKSEFSANAVYIQRKQDWTREYDEKLVFPHQEIHRIETGEPTPFNKKVFSSNFNYSLMEKDKYFLNAQLRYTRNDFPNGYEDRKSKLHTSGSDITLDILDHTSEKSNSPALDIYFQQNLMNNQLLIFNIVGTYIGTDSKRIYEEKDGNNTSTEILSNISGNKYSLIAEAIYEKKMGKSKITGGIRHLQSYIDNEYTGTTNANISMKQAESSLYAEYQIQSGKWGYMANFTTSRLYYSQNSNHNQKYAFQPSTRITFKPNDNLFFRYRINLHSNAPQLAAMNNLDQVIDDWQIRRGNPDLKAFNTLSQNLTASYSKGIFSIDLTIGYDHEYKPIMESVLYEDGRFIRTCDNQKSFQNLGTEATFKIKPWKDFVSLSVTPRINRFISKGNNYLHTYTMPELRVNLDISYNHWLANFTTITPPRYMYGEQLMKSDQMYTIMAGYKQTNWSVMLGALNPFTSEYKTDNRSWSALNPVNSKIHTTNNRSYLVKLGFNLNYGKQTKSGSKVINNADTDTSIMQGVKN